MDEKRFKAYLLGDSNSSPQEGMATDAVNGIPSNLSMHDKKFHPGGYKQGDSCKYRENQAKVDSSDKLGKEPNKIDWQYRPMRADEDGLGDGSGESGDVGFVKSKDKYDKIVEDAEDGTVIRAGGWGRKYVKLGGKWYLKTPGKKKSVYYRPRDEYDDGGPGMEQRPTYKEVDPSEVAKALRKEGVKNNGKETNSVDIPGVGRVGVEELGIPKEDHGDDNTWDARGEIRRAAEQYFKEQRKMPRTMDLGDGRGVKNPWVLDGRGAIDWTKKGDDRFVVKQQGQNQWRHDNPTPIKGGWMS